MKAVRACHPKIQKATENDQTQDKLSAFSFFPRKGRKILNHWRQL